VAYVPPTFEEFTAIFPAFAGVDEAVYDYWLNRAERVIDADYGDDQLHATILLTAHYLTVQGLGTNGEAQIAGFANANRVKSGSLELGWSSDRQSLDATRYGNELKPLVISVKGGPKVTGTGTVPVTPYRFPYWGI